MTVLSQKIEFSHPAASYEIVIGSGMLDQCGDWARRCLGNSVGKVVVVSNPKVFGIYGKSALDRLRFAGFEVQTFLMKDGEEHKSLRTAEAALKAFADAGLTRTDAVVALGGGVVGDLAGFAAAIYLRGIPFLQIPTTFLSMIDSSVGGKTGVNSAFGKNLIGAFHQPAGVLIDPHTLRTLETREMVAGFCEAIKHGSIAGRSLLKLTSNFLTKYPLENFSEHFGDSRFDSELAELISRNVTFKASVVSSDERESTNRSDRHSRKILNLGHTLAHALERATDYRYFKHGEAVGYGILFAAELSKSLALCNGKDVKLLNDVVHSVGSLPPLADIDEQKVLDAFSFDKKNISGSLQMVLLKGIARPVIISEKDIPKPVVRRVLKKFIQGRQI